MFSDVSVGCQSAVAFDQSDVALLAELLSILAHCDVAVTLPVEFSPILAYYTVAAAQGPVAVHQSNGVLLAEASASLDAADAQDAIGVDHPQSPHVPQYQ